ncbi:MAG: hypothetical protein U0X20_17660 [Caldilineaceae bacterium]
MSPGAYDATDAAQSLEAVMWLSVDELEQWIRSRGRFLGVLGALAPKLLPALTWQRQRPWATQMKMCCAAGRMEPVDVTQVEQVEVHQVA